MKRREQDPQAGQTSGNEPGVTALPEHVVSISPEALELTLFPPRAIETKKRVATRDNVIQFQKGPRKRPASTTSGSREDLKFQKHESGGASEPGIFNGRHAGRNPKRDGGPKTEQSSADDTPQTPLERLQNLLNAVEQKLLHGDIKPSVADWIRLTEMEREFTKATGPREVRVTWVTSDDADVKKIFGPRKRGPQDGRDAA